MPRQCAHQLYFFFLSVSCRLKTCPRYDYKKKRVIRRLLPFDIRYLYTYEDLEVRENPRTENIEHPRPEIDPRIKYWPRR